MPGCYDDWAEERRGYNSERRVRVLAARSKPAAVKKHFEDLESLLEREPGIEPAAETRRLFEELLR